MSAIATALADVIGDRKVVTGLSVLNEHLCRVRGELPPLPTNAVSIWFGQGATGEANLTGVYHKSDNPVVEVLIAVDCQLGQSLGDGGGQYRRCLQPAAQRQL